MYAHRLQSNQNEYNKNIATIYDFDYIVVIMNDSTNTEGSVNVRLGDLREELDALAKEYGYSLSQITRMCLKRGIPILRAGLARMNELSIESIPTGGDDTSGVKQLVAKKKKLNSR